MASFTLADLREIVDKCFEGAETVALDEATSNTEFADLGYDSLVVAEIVVRIHDDYGIRIPDDDVDELTTPAALIAYVDASIPAAQ